MKLAPNLLGSLLACIFFWLSGSAGQSALRSSSSPATQPTSQVASQPIDKKSVAELVRLLDDNSFKMREEATRKLIYMGAEIHPLLQAKLAEAGLPSEVALRIGRILKAPPNVAEATKRQDDAVKTFGLPKELALDLGGHIAMKFVLIPPGRSMMGSPPDEVQRLEDESQHEVEITRPFYMAIYTVTQEQYEQITGKNPSLTKGPANPIENVPWEDAAEFCRKVSEKTGLKAALPTEAQWEYACRAGTTTTFNTGRIITTDDANFKGSEGYGNNPIGEYRQRILPVGTFAPNSWGLYDMHGNVWQWCADWHDHNYYAQSPKYDPMGPKTGQNHVARGGCSSDPAGRCRSAARLSWPSRVAMASGYLGFRVTVAIGDEAKQFLQGHRTSSTVRAGEKR